MAHASSGPRAARSDTVTGVARCRRRKCRPAPLRCRNRRHGGGARAWNSRSHRFTAVDGQPGAPEAPGRPLTSASRRRQREAAVERPSRNPQPLRTIPPQVNDGISAGCCASGKGERPWSRCATSGPSRPGLALKTLQGSSTARHARSAQPRAGSHTVLRSPYAAVQRDEPASRSAADERTHHRTGTTTGRTAQSLSQVPRCLTARKRVTKRSPIPEEQAWSERLCGPLHL